MIKALKPLDRGFRYVTHHYPLILFVVSSIVLLLLTDFAAFAFAWGWFLGYNLAFRHPNKKNEKFLRHMKWRID